jgi:hypothetical protein
MQKMNTIIIENQRKAYRESFFRYGESPRGVKWNNIETQYLRFERLIYYLRNYLKNSTIHDIGSGLCDFHKFLLKNKIKHKYSGSEIVQEMIDYSLIKFNDITLYNQDFLKISKEKYDFIFLSGTLNLKLNTLHSEWERYSYELINKMFQHAKKAIVFNCLNIFNTFSDDELMYFNPLDVLDYCIKNLSRFVIIDNSYPLYEFTVTIFKKEFIEENYKGKHFKKYFK